MAQCSTQPEKKIVLTFVQIFGYGFGNQSYLMVHLLTLANLLVQFRCKNNPPSFSQYIWTMNYVSSQMYKCCFNNLTMFLRYDKMCVTLLTGRDVDRYVTFLAIARDDDRFYPLKDHTASFQVLKCCVKCDANSIPYEFVVFFMDFQHSSSENTAMSSILNLVKFKCKILTKTAIQFDVQVPHPHESLLIDRCRVLTTLSTAAAIFPVHMAVRALLPLFASTTLPER